MTDSMTDSMIDLMIDSMIDSLIDQERSKLLLSGSLEGLILSRTHQESIEVLQAYVDRWRIK